LTRVRMAKPYASSMLNACWIHTFITSFRSMSTGIRPRGQSPRPHREVEDGL
jgi:hypothetical protein